MRVDIRRENRFMSGFEDYLDKLWLTLFGKGVRGLSAPDELRRRSLDRRTVRARELREIARVQHELQGLVEGRLRMTRDGNLREAADDELMQGVKLNSVIVSAGFDDPVESLDTARLLRQADRDGAMRAVRRDLAIRHIAILAEEECRNLPLEKVSKVQVDPDWLVRWRDGAQDAVSVQLKRYWARLLAGEVLKPSTYSVRTMEFMRTISRADLEMINICARLCFDGFIYRNPGTYFSPELHQPMFEQMEELGLLRGVYGRPESWTMTSTTEQGFSTMLACSNKAIFVEGGSAEDDFRVPVYRLTRFGREVLSLCRVDADMAYMLAVAGELKKKGFSVRLGDWVGDAGQGLFAERMAV
jgi:hypothetical protein